MGNLNCFAVVVPGLEQVAADELRALAAHDAHPEPGGVSFTASMDGLFRINLRSRVATRILIRLAGFRALSFPELYNKCKKTPWEQFIGSDTQLNVRASCHGSKLIHSGRAAQALADAVRDRLGFEPAGSREQQLLLRIDNNDCVLSIDSSGDRLDRRGYRLHSGRAPLRETTAAGLLQWGGWRSDQPLLTPMCGAGTFAIEAAWMAEKRAAGLEHAFALLQWPSLKQKRWQRVLERARAMHADSGACILASDLDGAMLAQARANAAQAGVSDLIAFRQLDARRLTPPERGGPGLIICNPPYGDRVGGDARALYADLGRLFRTRFSGWHMVIIVPDAGCGRVLAHPPEGRLEIRHGGKRVHVLKLRSR